MRRLLLASPPLAPFLPFPSLCSSPSPPRILPRAVRPRSFDRSRARAASNNSRNCCRCQRCWLAKGAQAPPIRGRPRIRVSIGAPGRTNVVRSNSSLRGVGPARGRARPIPPRRPRGILARGVICRRVCACYPRAARERGGPAPPAPPGRCAATSRPKTTLASRIRPSTCVKSLFHEPTTKGATKFRFQRSEPRSLADLAPTLPGPRPVHNGLPRRCHGILFP